jgi:uracil-DNA glycosylase
MSHTGKGWENFTDAVINTLSEKRDFLIFLLWGSHAQKKKTLIDTTKHIILEAPHPSPLSAHRGFLGCGHFNKTNALLREHDSSEIQW